MSDAARIQLDPPTAIRATIGGCLMGLANLVPGISGGTMLLAVGVYPQFVGGVAEVSTFRFRLATVGLLGCVVGAALIAFVGLAATVGGLVVDHRWIMYSLFIGLTLGGVPLLLRMLGRLDAGSVVAAAAGIGLMTLLAFTTPAGSGDGAGGRAYAMLFVAGIAGASAMILPGISGAYLLLVLGQYVTIVTTVGAMKDAAVDRDWAAVGEAMHVIVPVAAGVVVGVVGVSNVVKLCLTRFERATLGLLLGLLVGAVLGLWPFRESIDGDAEVTRTFTPSAVQIVVALALVGAGFAMSSLVARIGGSPAAEGGSPAGEGGHDSRGSEPAPPV